MLASNGPSKEQPVAAEIEHKYLVYRNLWTPRDSGVLYRQGYLSSVKERVVRVRIAGNRAYLTVKGLMTGVTRLEFEYAIPMADAATILDQLCERPLIEKTRYREEYKGHVWEIERVTRTMKVCSSPRSSSLPSRSVMLSHHGRELKCRAIPAISMRTSGLNPYKNWKPRDA
jgi:hypothetical protein